ncbi:hypothetical protein Btru_023108 [Bulinus truncatus]|nr:hypothetical protein Btru_023108 [Bulinus truncatus]
MVGQLEGSLHNLTFKNDEGSRVLVSDEVRAMIILVNNVIIGSCICLFGIVANILNLIVFVKMGLRDTVTISLFGLTLSDLCGLLTLQWTSICFNPLFHYSDIAIESFEVEYITAGVPHVCFTRITGLITAYITLERCLCISLPLKVKSILTPRRTVVIVTLIFTCIIAIAIPGYTVYSLGINFYPARNRSLIGLVFQGNRATVEAIAFASTIVLCYVAFLVVVACTVILVIKLNNQTKWRQVSSSAAPEGTATSQTSKDRRVVKMVVTISTMFIVCYMPITLVLIGTMAVPEFGMIGRYENLYHAISSFGYSMESINSSMSIFVYLRMSSKYRAIFLSRMPGLNCFRGVERKKNGYMSSGEMSSGYMSSGKMSSGEMSSGEMSSGEMSSGEKSSGEMSSGEMSSGEMSSGYISSGEMSSGEMSSVCVCVCV